MHLYQIGRIFCHCWQTFEINAVIKIIYRKLRGTLSSSANLVSVTTVTAAQKDEAHFKYFVAGAEFYRLKNANARQQNILNARAIQNLDKEDDLLEMRKRKLKLDIELKEIELKE